MNGFKSSVSLSFSVPGGRVLEIRSCGSLLAGIRYLPAGAASPCAAALAAEGGSCCTPVCVPASGLAAEAAHRLELYFSGSLRVFDLPLEPARTSFLAAVRSAMLSIPYGETVSYSELARMAGYPGAVRAAALACRNNPFMIVVPCHRVVGKNGSLTGYAGGLQLKQVLIDIEQGRR